MCSVLVRLMLLLLLRSLTVCVCFNRVYECHTVNACLEYSAFLRWIWLCVCFVSVLRSADIFIIARANTFWSFAPKNARTLAHSHTHTLGERISTALFFFNIIRLNSVTTEVARACCCGCWYCCWVCYISDCLRGCVRGSPLLCAALRYAAAWAHQQHTAVFIKSSARIFNEARSRHQSMYEFFKTALNWFWLHAESVDMGDLRFALFCCECVRLLWRVCVLYGLRIIVSVQVDPMRFQFDSFRLTCFECLFYSCVSEWVGVSMSTSPIEHHRSCVFWLSP